MINDRPATKLMKESLVECYLRELNGKPSNPFNTKFSKGLLERGLLEMRPYHYLNSNLKDALYLTKSGREIIEPLYKKAFK